MEYLFPIYLDDTKIKAETLYVQVSERCRSHDICTFSDEINYHGGDGTFEKVLFEKCRALERQMEETINAFKGSLKDTLVWSLPLELVSSESHNIEPDYIYEWPREAILSDREYIHIWNKVKRDATSLEEHLLHIAEKNSIDTLIVREPVDTTITRREYIDKYRILFSPFLNKDHSDLQVHIEVDHIFDSSHLFC